jgi:hypothetical protein
VGGGDIPMDEQKVFPENERVLLMHLRRPVVTEGPNKSWSITEPVGDADSIVLWIESEPVAEGEK